MNEDNNIQTAQPAGDTQPAEPGKRSGWSPAAILTVLLAAVLLAAFVLVVARGHPSVPSVGKDALYGDTAQPEKGPAGELDGEISSPSDGETDGTRSNTLQAVTALAENTGLYGAETPGAQNIVAEYDGKTLTNQIFQYYYWDLFFNFYSSNADYLSYYLSLSTPFDQQQFSETQTWHDYFAQLAVDNWVQTETLCSQAEAEGYVLSDDDEQYLTQTLDSLNEYAASNGYSSANEYLRFMFDPCCEVQSYETYLRRSTLAGSYANARYRQFYEEQYDPAAELTYCVNVRHILIQPEEGSDIPDAEAAQKKAEEIYALFLAEPTEEKFAALAGEYSDDPGSVDNGGLYEDVAPGRMVAEFNDWCFDASRQPGDHGIVQTSYGSHIMYFVGESTTVADDPNEEAAQTAYELWLDELFAGAEAELFSEDMVFTQRETLTVN